MASHVLMWYSIKHINRTIELIQENLKSQQTINDSNMKAITSIINAHDNVTTTIMKIANAVASLTDVVARRA